MKKKLKFPDVDTRGIAVTISDEAKDFIVCLLDKDPEKRIGSAGDVGEVLSHTWFESLDCEMLKKK